MGDPLAFERLVRRYKNELFAYLQHYLGDAHKAEDAFQQAFLQVYLKCNTFDPNRKFRAWLYAIATHQAIDMQRKARRHNVGSLDKAGGAHDGIVDESSAVLGEAISDDSFISPLDCLIANDRVADVERAISTITETCREVFQLICIQGLQYHEVAEKLHIPIGTVKSRLNAARQRVRAALMKQDPDLVGNLTGE